MASKKHRVVKRENILVFPGMTERLITEGHQFAENYQYKEAIACFEKALVYEEGDEATLTVYAFALYELKLYDKAKQVCEELLAMGTSKYLEVMELYITIGMQVKDFQQVETLIDSLIEENIIPPEQLEKFARLKTINAEVSKNRQGNESVDNLIEENQYELGNFTQLAPNEQAMYLHRLMDANVRQLKEALKAIIECEEIHPFIKSLALILLVEQEVSLDIQVCKFEQIAVVNPADLNLPNRLSQYEEVKQLVERKLEQDPTTLEMVDYLMAKHAIVTYPFGWKDFAVDDIAYSYINLVQSMLGKVQEMDYEIIDYLQTLEKLSELNGV
ncbi:MAG: hypothetical protein RR595_04115 [Lysinibacillus sp.]